MLSRFGRVVVTPGAALVAATLLLLPRLAGAAQIAAASRLAPPVIFGAGLLLAARMRRSRVVFGLLVLALAERALALAPGLPPDLRRLVLPAVATLLPLDLALLAWRRERGVLSPAGLVFAASLCLQLGAVLFAPAAWRARALELLTAAPLPLPLRASWPLPQPALVAFSLAASLLLALGLGGRSAGRREFLWALVAAFAALVAGAGPERSLALGAAAGALVLSVVEVSYSMAYLDELTGLPGRRALEEELLRLGGRFTLAIADVDRFKRLNDRYGHDVGDQALRWLASHLGSVGGGGRAFRYGGEEFAILFSGKALSEARSHLETLRARIAGSGLALRAADRPTQRPSRRPRADRRDAARLAITVSIGAAERDARHRSPAQVLRAADKALYRAKRAGRNRVKP